ncbi:putative nuclease of the RNAse H fold, HicB family [Methanophagales archaeon]|nr:putative nuclease of the RNAse H fold, HicB family [Methanophagales archaeon]
MTIISLEIKVFKDGDAYVALCPELNVSSFGDDIKSAKESLREALEAFLEECEAMGTLQEVLEDAGFVREKESWILEEPVIKEKIALSC